MLPVIETHKIILKNVNKNMVPSNNRRQAHVLGTRQYDGPSGNENLTTIKVILTSLSITKIKV